MTDGIAAPFPPPITLTLADEAATARLAGRIADHLAPGDVVTLTGTLGAGKTALARALIRHLGDAGQEVPSPTFTLVQTYALPGFDLWHFDLYRLSDPGEVDELGWDEVRSGGVALVEWPDRLGPLLPADRLAVALTIAAEDVRHVTLTGHGAWAARLPGVVAGLADGGMV